MMYAGAGNIKENGRALSKLLGQVLSTDTASAVFLHREFASTFLLMNTLDLPAAKAAVIRRRGDHYRAGHTLEGKSFRMANRCIGRKGKMLHRDQAVVAHLSRILDLDEDRAGLAAELSGGVTKKERALLGSKFTYAANVRSL